MPWEMDADSPLYGFQQVAADLRRRIEAGEFKTRRLPSLMDLQGYYGVSGTLMKRAIGILVDDGLIIAVRSRGYFIAGKD